MQKAKQVLAKMFSSRYRWVSLGVIALMILLARLGIWQIERLGERREANAMLVEAVNGPPINLNDEAESIQNSVELVDMENRTVTAQGSYDTDAQMMLKLQTVQGRPGVHLVTPLVLDGLDRIVLVDRGWIPDADVESGRWTDYGPVDPVIVTGYLTLSDTPLRQSVITQGPTGPLREIYRVDLNVLQEEFPGKLLSFYIEEAPDSVAPDQLPYRAEQEVDLSEGPHLGYAFQWFIFSSGLGIAYIIFVNRQIAIEGIGKRDKSSAAPANPNQPN